jgi:preprotein translocase subunit SecA
MNRIAVDNTTGESTAAWTVDTILSEVNSVFGRELEAGAIPVTTADAVVGQLEDIGSAWFEDMVKSLCTTPTGELNLDRLVQLGRWFLLQAVDRHWIDHLRNMEQLRYGVHWEAQAQKDPKVVYKREGRAIFEQMLDAVDTEVVRNLFHVRIEEPQARAAEAAAPAPQISADDDGDTSASSSGKWTPAEDVGKKAIEAARQVSQRARQDGPATATSIRRNTPGPNDPCHCGSGRKYKKCHMTADQQGIADLS